MVIIVLVLALIFVSSAFFSGLPPRENLSPLITYFFLQQNFVVKYYLFFLLGFVVLSIIFFRANFDKRFSNLKIFSLSALQTLATFATGFFVAYFFLLIIAFIHLNIFSMMLSNDLKSLGVVDDREVIANILKDNINSPEVIVPDEKGAVFAIAKATSGTKNFYGKYLLSAVPSFLVIPINKTLPKMLMIDNVLIITEVEKQDIEELGPYIGYLFVKSYFPARNIKSYPFLSVMDRTEYDEHRKKDALKKIEKIDAAVSEIEGYISSISAEIESENTATVGGKKVFSPDERRQNEATVALLDEYTYYYNFYKTQKEKLQQFTTSVPHEMGVFVPNDTIRIVYFNSSSHSLGDYIESLVHEYLHYASYVSNEKRFESTFFEEGLTEYFARQITKEVLHVDTRLGYPAQVAIITEITDLITASELADIYFAKDEISLQKALDRVYGDNFYVNNFILFESLQYTSDRKQILEIANEIMRRIGGEPLTEKDLLSSYSSL